MPYRTLEDIQDRKDALYNSISQDNEHIRTLWNQLFVKPEPLSALSPSKRIGSMITTGASLVDGLILGWKLYRKFKRK